MKRVSRDFDHLFRYMFGSHGRVTIEKQFGTFPVSFALQTTVKV